MSAAEDKQRSQIDAKNASMLGYDSSLVDSTNLAGTPLEVRRQDLLAAYNARLAELQSGRAALRS